MAGTMSQGGFDFFFTLPQPTRRQAKLDFEIKDRTFSILEKLENEDGSTPVVLEFSEKVVMSKVAEVAEVSEKEEGPWVQFLKSPHFTVITTGLLAVLAGAAMYAKLDSKIDALRLETKADLQLMTQHTDSRLDKVDSRFDKIDSKFDKIDAKFDAILSKMDSDSKEMRSLIQSEKK